MGCDKDPAILDSTTPNHGVYCRDLSWIYSWDLPRGLGSSVPNTRMDMVFEFEFHPVDSKKLEYGPGTIYASCPSSLGFGVGPWRTVMFQFAGFYCSSNVSGPFENSI